MYSNLDTKYETPLSLTFANKSGVLLLPPRVCQTRPLHMLAVASRTKCSFSVLPAADTGKASSVYASPAHPPSQ
jgi:hypothetical protein